MLEKAFSRQCFTQGYFDGDKRVIPSMRWGCWCVLYEMLKEFGIRL